MPSAGRSLATCQLSLARPDAPTPPGSATPPREESDDSALASGSEASDDEEVALAVEVILPR